MDFVCDIAYCVGNMFSLFFDKLWWKDYGIPLIGTVGIPLVVWILTRYYGADKAEERKELRQLRDNLNLLLNFVGFNIISLFSINRYTTKLSLQINNNTLNIVQLEKEGFFDVLFFSDLLRDIDIKKYAQCLSKDDRYLQNLIMIKNLNYQIDIAIKHRNDIVNDISKCENSDVKYARITAFVEASQKDLYHLNNKIDAGIKKAKEFINETKTLESKFNNLKLITIDFDDNDFYKKAKKEYEQFLNQLKDNENDQ